MDVRSPEVEWWLRSYGLRDLRETISNYVVPPPPPLPAWWFVNQFYARAECVWCKDAAEPYALMYNTYNPFEKNVCLTCFVGTCYGARGVFNRK